MRRLLSSHWLIFDWRGNKAYLISKPLIWSATMIAPLSSQNFLSMNSRGHLYPAKWAYWLSDRANKPSLSTYPSSMSIGMIESSTSHGSTFYPLMIELLLITFISWDVYFYFIHDHLSRQGSFRSSFKASVLLWYELTFWASGLHLYVALSIGIHHQPAWMPWSSGWLPRSKLWMLHGSIG